MKILDHDELNSFINALQLSITSEIIATKVDENNLIIKFYEPDPKDTGLAFLKKIVSGSWHEENDSYKIPLTPEMDWPLLTNFLLLSRLKPENIMSLAQKDQRYANFAKKTDLIQQEEYHQLKSLDDVSKEIFTHISQKKLTLREVASKSGLTQTALSNFKSGNDIRFSSLIKIINALDLKIGIKS